MLNLFQLKNNKLSYIDYSDIKESYNAIWIDMIHPSNDELNFVHDLLGQSIVNPFIKEFRDISYSRRFFKNDNGIHIQTFFFNIHSNYDASNVDVFFIINDGRLYTLCNVDFSLFSFYQMHSYEYSFKDGNVYELLLVLFDLKCDQLIDYIEYVHCDLEKLVSLIMDRRKLYEYDNILSRLALLEEFIWKIRLFLIDIQRVMKFLLREVVLPSAQVNQINKILINIDFLFSQNLILFQKVSFLIQLATRFMNVEQNRIVKIFSVIFLPPTLVASSYGMNFEFMPELKWPFGYPGAILLMILSGLAPYLYFKYKNWL